MRFIREFLEAVAPSGRFTAAEPKPIPAPVPVPEGNVPRKKRRQTVIIGGIILLLVIFLASRHPDPVSPVTVKNRNAPQFQTTPLTPEQVTQSGQQLQNQTNQALAREQEMRTAAALSVSQFGADPANTGIVDPNRETNLRRLNEEEKDGYGPGGSPAANANATARDARKEREALLERSLHASPFVAPTQMSRIRQGGSSSTSNHADEAEEHELRPVSEKEGKPNPYDWSRYEGKLHRILAGTVLRGVTKNGIEGSYSGPVVVQITDDVYSQDRSELIMKAGSILIGTAKSVNSQWQSRIETRFHRLIMPDGFSQGLQDLPGLSQRGEMGVTDKVNRHYGQTFGAALLIGAISGLSQIGNSTNGLGYDPGVSIRNGISQGTAQNAGRLLDKFADRPPTITIRPGSRVSLILDDDILLPEYIHHVIDKDL